MPNFAHAITQFQQSHILVIGDVILDEYITGKAERMSREAPIPVLEMQSRRYIAGGAANPAANVAALNAQASIVALVGDDDYADQLRTELHARRIDTTGLMVDVSRPTTVKTRILAQMGLRFPQQVARIDALSREPMSNGVYQSVITALQNAIPRATAVIVSDYHNGLLTPDFVRHIRAAVNEVDIQAFVDAQGALDKYKGFHIIKCNADDAANYLGLSLVTDSDFADAGLHLLRELQAQHGVIITRGGDGATVIETDETVTHCPSPQVSDVYDTVGAGDTAIAVTTLAVDADLSLPDAVRLANIASGIVVRHVGNYTPSLEELMATLA